MIDLDALSQAAADMPPLPASATRLATLASKPAPDLAAIVEVVGFDVSLTATLLRTANSGWSAPREQVTTVKDAVIRLGAGAVLTLAMGLHLHARLNRGVPEYGLEEGELWRHSVAASLAAETLARFATRPLPPETATAALLHDLGKLVIARHVGAVEQRAIERARELGVTRNQAEIEVLGVDHAELGGLIAQIWGLPLSLARGITHHHRPDRAPGLLTYGVHVADVVAKAVGAGPDDNADLEMYAEAAGELGLTADALDEVRRLVTMRFGDVLDRFA